MSQADIVTKEYLDNRLESIKKDLLIQMWTIDTILIGVMAAFEVRSAVE